jgi:hypothetical protein
MWGIPNWEPKFVESTPEVLALCRGMATAIIGREIECSWVAWHHSYDEWWNNAPVILRINGVNYEICWSKESDFALTRDTIDVESPCLWADTEDSIISWRKDALPILQNLKGRRVLTLELHEAQVTIGTPETGGISNQYWVPHSLNLTCDDAFLSIYNAFDCNGLRTAVWAECRVFQL